MLAHGTTTVEAKSGYGLTATDELRSLRILRDLARTRSCRASCRRCSRRTRVPPEFRGRPGGVGAASWPTRSSLARPREKLARFCDVFCEDGVFTVEESRHDPRGGRRAGLGLRIHADELARSGGALLAAELGAASADHLLFIRRRRDRGARPIRHGRGDPARDGLVDALAAGAGARAMIAAGVPVAVASDSNPGTCYTESLAAVAAARLPRLGAHGRRDADRHDAERGGVARARRPRSARSRSASRRTSSFSTRPTTATSSIIGGSTCVHAVVLRGRVAS